MAIKMTMKILFLVLVTNVRSKCIDKERLVKKLGEDNYNKAILVFEASFDLSEEFAIRIVNIPIGQRLIRIAVKKAYPGQHNGNPPQWEESMFLDQMAMSPGASCFPTYYGCYDDENLDSHIVFEAVEEAVDWKLISVKKKSIKPSHQDFIINQLEVFLKIAEVVNYFHISGFIHNNLTPNSFGMTRNGSFKLKDWSSVVPKGCFNYNGSEEYMDFFKYARHSELDIPSDEVKFVRKAKSQEGADIWSLGMTFFLLAAPENQEVVSDLFKTTNKRDIYNFYMRPVREMVVSGDWIVEHSLDVAVEESEMSFPKILNNMMMLNREPRAFCTSKKVVDDLQTLIYNVNKNNYVMLGPAPKEKALVIPVTRIQKRNAVAPEGKRRAVSTIREQTGFIDRKLGHSKRPKKDPKDHEKILEQDKKLVEEVFYLKPKPNLIQKIFGGCLSPKKII